MSKYLVFRKIWSKNLIITLKVMTSQKLKHLYLVHYNVEDHEILGQKILIKTV